MVFFFTVCDSGYTVFMGLDQHENEFLILNGTAGDIWFHVDSVSSAHVYLRFPDGEEGGLDNIPEDVRNDCAQLVKANSISGNKQNNVRVVYTLWQNLKKTGDMNVGQVSYHNTSTSSRRLMTVEARDNAVVNRLLKTRTEISMADFKANKAERELKQRSELNQAKMKQRAEKERLMKDKEDKQKESDDFYSNFYDTSRDQDDDDGGDPFGDEFDTRKPAARRIRTKAPAAAVEVTKDDKKAKRQAASKASREKRQQRKLQREAEAAAAAAKAAEAPKTKTKTKGKKKAGKKKKGKKKKTAA